MVLRILYLFFQFDVASFRQEQQRELPTNREEVFPKTSIFEMGKESLMQRGHNDHEDFLVGTFYLLAVLMFPSTIF